jgi:hypothetical protein
MPFGMRVIIFAMGLTLFGIIFELVRRGKFRQELSIAWFAVGILLMVSSVGDRLLVDPLARKLHIGYPPVLVGTWILFGLIIALLYFSAVISDLKGKIKELSQKIALMELEMTSGRVDDSERNKDTTAPDS